MTPPPIRILLWFNGILLLGHIGMEQTFGDLNALRLGERSLPSKGYISVEGIAVLCLFGAVFNHFYPDMRGLARSRVTWISASVIAVELIVWFSYK